MLIKSSILTLLFNGFSFDELFYIIITFLSLKGTEGFQTEQEAAQLMNKKDGTFIGDYRKKIEEHGIWKRDRRYNKINKRNSSYIIFNYPTDWFLKLVDQYFQELQLFLDQPDQDSSQYLLCKNRLEQINIYINNKR